MDTLISKRVPKRSCGRGIVDVNIGWMRCSELSRTHQHLWEHSDEGQGGAPRNCRSPRRRLQHVQSMRASSASTTSIIFSRRSSAASKCFRLTPWFRGARTCNVIVQEKRTGSFNFGAGFPRRQLARLRGNHPGNFDVTRGPTSLAVAKVPLPRTVRHAPQDFILRSRNRISSITRFGWRGTFLSRSVVRQRGV